MNWRTEILNATAEALRLHQKLGIRESVLKTGGGIDIFGTIHKLSVPLLFRPLDNLLGAYIPKPTQGIMITTERSLAIQRFTASHELGHLILDHKGSIDDASILGRSPFGMARYSPMEGAADAFASSFLIPEWLLLIHAEKQNWNVESFNNPMIVYQLSLRVGVSYRAVCNALLHLNILSQKSCTDLLKIRPRVIKQSLLKDHTPPNWHCDVWVLTEKDQGTVIQGGSDDIFLFSLKEHSGAGYLWNVEDLKKEGFDIVSNNVIISDNSEGIGSPANRLLVARRDMEAAGKLDLKQVRPWEDSPEDAIHFTMGYDLFGKEHGLSRSQRERLMAA